jgi:shikimate kinase
LLNDNNFNAFIYLNLKIQFIKKKFQMILSKPIVLVGMMGCGKSTIGKIVAEKLNWFFLDSDKEIENEMNLSTKDIFDKYGEKFFRNKEYEIFQFYSKKKNILISSGGGSFCQKITYGIIKECFFSIWLDVNEDILFQRLKKNKNKRPLLNSLNDNGLRRKIKEIMFERKDCYIKANKRIELNEQSIKESSNKTYLEITNYHNQ